MIIKLKSLISEQEEPTPQPGQQPPAPAAPEASPQPEQQPEQPAGSPYYNFAKEFNAYQQEKIAAIEEIKAKYEKSLQGKLKGKKIKARASIGYKQFEKDYDIDVADVSIDNYFGNEKVTVTGQNKKEYILNPSNQIQITGTAQPTEEPPKPEAPEEPAPEAPTQPEKQPQLPQGAPQPPSSQPSPAQQAPKSTEQPPQGAPPEEEPEQPVPGKKQQPR